MREDKFQQVMAAVDRAVTLEMAQQRGETDYGEDNLTDDQIIRVKAWRPSEFKGLRIPNKWLDLSHLETDGEIDRALEMEEHCGRRREERII